MKTSNSEYELIGEKNGKLVVRVKHMGNQVITITNEARACLTVLGNRHFDYPIYFDLEEKWQFANGRNFCDSLVKSFCSILEQNGCYAGLYISRSPLQNYISPLLHSVM